MGTTFYYGEAAMEAVPASSVASLIGMILPLFLMIGIPMIVLRIIGVCKVFKKAGRPAGFAFIPFYNTYVSFDIAGCKNMFWGYLAVTIISSICSNIITYSGRASVGALIGALVCLIANVVISIVWYVKLAKSFGKSGGFAVGLIFLSPIFMMILGCGDSQYQGKIPQRARAKQADYETWKCPACGAYNLVDNNFCFHCGRQKRG